MKPSASPNSTFSCDGTGDADIRTAGEGAGREGVEGTPVKLPSCRGIATQSKQVEPRWKEDSPRTCYSQAPKSDLLCSGL